MRQVVSRCGKYISADSENATSFQPQKNQNHLMAFRKLELIEPILKALADEGYTIPTPIQQQSIPLILERKDLLGCAQTGTGKTAAFAIPILQILYEDKPAVRGPKHIKTLILTPTRELAIQIGESFAAYGKYTGLTHTVIFGGVSQIHQTSQLQRGVDILIATPGRLLDLMSQGYIGLQHLKILDRKSTRLNSSHPRLSRMPSSA